MPIYEYRCQNDHRFEVLQKFADDPITECEVCGAPAQRVLHPSPSTSRGRASTRPTTAGGRRPGRRASPRDRATASRPRSPRRRARRAARRAQEGRGGVAPVLVPGRRARSEGRRPETSSPRDCRFGRWCEIRRAHAFPAPRSAGELRGRRGARSPMEGVETMLLAGRDSRCRLAASPGLEHARRGRVARRQALGDRCLGGLADRPHAGHAEADEWCGNRGELHAPQAAPLHAEPAAGGRRDSPRRRPVRPDGGGGGGPRE